MTLPHFFIVGAAKSGTTSLHFYLKQHPQIFMPKRKEPCFFVDWKGGVQTRREYEALFSEASDRQKIGEASTPYLFDPETPKKIRALVADARILIILRDPVETAFSLWRMNRAVWRARERLSFREALAAEPTRKLSREFRKRCTLWWHGNYYYFNRGLYHEQVKRYLATFGRDRVKVMLFEDLKQKPVKICREIFSFLEVDPDFIPEIEIHNPSVEFRSRWLHLLLTQTPGIGKISVLSKNTSSWVSRGKAYLMRLNRLPAPVLDADLRRELRQKYSSDVEQLSRLIGKNLSAWL